MKYPTQRVALAYFICAMVLFGVQIVVGVLAGTVYVFPNFLSDVIPFNVLRMIHTNALIVWLLMGFFGCGYYLVPEEAERDIESPMLAYVQLGLLMFGALAAVVGYVFGIHEGREFLEQPLWIKAAIVVVALIYLYNISMTILKGRKTAIGNVLLLGMWGIAVFWLFAFYNPGNIALDKVYWWYIVHLWVEGVWELIMGGILAFLLIKLTGIDRERRFMHWYINGWMFNYLRMNPWWKIEFVGKERLPKGGSVFVANHQSLADILVSLLFWRTGSGRGGYLGLAGGTVLLDREQAVQGREVRLGARDDDVGVSAVPVIDTRAAATALGVDAAVVHVRGLVVRAHAHVHLTESVDAARDGLLQTKRCTDGEYIVTDANVL